MINTAFGGQGIFNGSGSPFINRYRSQTRLPEGQYGKLIQFLRNDLSPLSLINKVKILKNGESTFPEIFEAVERAKHHIHLEYYIYSEDDIGTELAELLLKKAQSGVEVRMIVDGVGSLQLSKAFFKRLNEGGVELMEK